MPHVVKAGDFEGPLELLLELIEKRKFHVSDVSLAAVADDFVNSLRERQEFPLDEAASFLNLAATLMLIKSKSLLPSLEISEEESAGVEELEERLRRYQQLRHAARKLEKIFAVAELYPRGDAPMVPSFRPSADLTLEALQQAVANTLANLPSIEHLPQAKVRTILSLETMLASIVERLSRGLAGTLAQCAEGDRERLIVGFLAVLELVRRGAIIARQSADFGDISLESEKSSLPSYI